MMVLPAFLGFVTNGSHLNSAGETQLVTGCTTKESELNFWQEQVIFFSPTTFVLALGPTQSPLWRVLGLKHLGHEADHTIPSDADVKNVYIIQVGRVIMFPSFESTVSVCVHILANMIAVVCHCYNMFQATGASTYFINSRMQFLNLQNMFIWTKSVLCQYFCTSYIIK